MQTKPAATAPIRLGHYTIDPEASAVSFRTRHLFGLAPVQGTFAVQSGTVDVAEPLTRSQVRLQVDAASFRSGSGARDRAVRSPRFLDTGRHPIITFTSQIITLTSRDNDAVARVTGTVTVRDTTCLVSVPVSLADVTAGSFTVHGMLQVDRTEFGLTASRGLAGRYLDLTLTLRLRR
jgi:polyisoprenoid-binding protein YceI